MNDLIDIEKKNITLEESQTHLKFETAKEFSQVKINCHFWKAIQ